MNRDTGEISPKADGGATGRCAKQQAFAIRRIGVIRPLGDASHRASRHFDQLKLRLAQRRVVSMARSDLDRWTSEGYYPVNWLTE
jgi:hypothetical protein